MVCTALFRRAGVFLTWWVFAGLVFSQAANAAVAKGSAGDGSCVSTIASDAANPGCGPAASIATSSPPKSVTFVKNTGDRGIGEELMDLKLHSQILLLLVAVLVCISGWVVGLVMGIYSPKRSRKTNPGKAIATVNGVKIPVSRFQRLVANALAEGSVDTPQLREALLDDLVFREALAQDAQRIGLLSDDRNAIRIEGARENALVDLWFANYFKTHPVTEADIRADYYEQLKSGEVPQNVQEYQLSMIVVASEEEAFGIIDQLHRGALFAELAKEKSLDLESALRGGALGWVLPSQLASPIDELVFALLVGHLSRPIQTEQGWLIVKVDDIKYLPAKSFDEAKFAIAQKKLQERRQEAVARLLAGAKIVKALQPSPPAASARKDPALR